MGAALSVSETLGSQISEEVLPLSAEKIGGAIATIWQDTHDTFGAGQSVARVCLNNLIVVTDDENHSSADELTRDLARRQPSRIFLVCVSDRAEKSGVWVQTACHVGSSPNALVCYEVIAITVRPADVNAVASLIRSLLVDSVPVIGVDFRRIMTAFSLDRALIEMTDRLFVNADAIPAAVTAIDFLPLRWYATLPMREAIARAMDLRLNRNYPDMPIAITVSHDPPEEETAALLVGWMVSRLRQHEWTIHSRQPLVLRHQAGRTITFNLVDRGTTGEPPVRLQFTDREQITIAGNWLTQKRSPMLTVELGDQKEQVKSNDYPLAAYILAGTKDASEFDDYRAAMACLVDLELIHGDYRRKKG